ncbi:MAG: hypothetical protein U9R56_05740, partial [candidate division Zixibacteria bacterium]|nr:hypothetical protein [candidate division Zixibacteria bacterium]
MGIEALWSAQERDEVRLGYQRIENILKKCHQTESLLWISERSQYAFNNPDFWDQIDEHHIHPWLLAFIARTLLKVTSDTNRPRTLDHSIYEEIWNIYYKLNSPGEDRTLNFAQLFLINITYEQFYWQESIKNLIPRYYLILSHRADEQDRLRKKRNELTEYISAMTGLDFVDYMRLSFIAWMTMREIGHYDPARITGHTIKAFHETCTESKVNAFTSFVSKGKKGLRDMINSQANSHPLMEAYCLNPLFRHPIVNLGSTS